MYIVIKAVLDRIIAFSLLLLLLVPLLVLCAVIWSSGGSPIYTQWRIGKGKENFKIYKFRTMHVNANELLNEAGEPIQNRVTRIGYFLRKYSIDEIPQLLNILIGDMSFIGPRPVLVDWGHKFIGNANKRFLVNPGVTGLAQVNGRNSIAWSVRVAFDIEYVEKISLYEDIKILFKTIKVVLLKKNIVMDRNPGAVDDL